MPLASYLLGLGSALLVGFSKTGLPGVSIPGIVLMAEAFPEDAKLSLGAILPVLLAGDVFAVCWYRHHAQWGRLLGLFPYVAAGMVPGACILLWVEGNGLRPVLGWLILGLLAIEVGRRWNEARSPKTAPRAVDVGVVRSAAAALHQPPCPLGPTCTCGQYGVVAGGPAPANGTVPRLAESPGSVRTAGNRPLPVMAVSPTALPLSLSTSLAALAASPIPVSTSHATPSTHCPPGPSPPRLSSSWWFMAAMGFLAGLSTVIANAAMPVMTIYLISRRLRKEHFIGTAAWFFFLINLSKLPICWAIPNVITPTSIRFGLIVAPMTVVGALVGVYVLKRIPQRFFDALALALAGVAAVRLIVA
jgi:uncharacterized membrane protein YfcA